MSMSPKNILAAAIWAGCFLLAPACQAQDSVGVLMLHGKNPGGPQDPNFNFLKTRLEREGMQVLLPDMPWSRNRYIDGNWDQAMDEINAHVKSLRDQGAQKIVLIGHSMGAPASLSYSARGGDVQAIVMLAPGHIPLGYYTYPALSIVRESIDEARKRVAEGKGDSTDRFNDINQGKQMPVVMTARNYLSYFDPNSDAEMSVSAPKIPPATPTLVVIGDKDPLFARVNSYFVNKLPSNPQSKYLEVKATHLTTPRESEEEVVAWIKDVVGK